MPVRHSEPPVLCMTAVSFNRVLTTSMQFGYVALPAQARPDQARPPPHPSFVSWVMVYVYTVKINQ